MQAMSIEQLCEVYRELLGRDAPTKAELAALAEVDRELTAREVF